MSPIAHRIYLLTLTVIALAVTLAVGIYGANYYQTNLEERFFHDQNEILKPSGFVGHGLGITGSFMMLVGVFGYMARKRFRSLSRLGLLKHWLEFHIFLCTLGPFLVLYHTAFKFGGLVAISFWSMVAVVASGVVGRFIYLQIPRTIEGRELNLSELSHKKTSFFSDLKEKFALEDDLISFLSNAFVSEEDLYQGSFFSKMRQRLRFEKILRRNIKQELLQHNLSKKVCKRMIKIVSAEIVLTRRIAWLETMHKFLEHWHVIHLPFALIMLVIMVIHVAVVALFGYTWIF
ncbi:hypothetical protein [Saccharicrinis sp. GN24d3]|uniref:hypothetical protein n=1 Tax=Saccharicrinis sp. GN24d3 TaxID=3458416 RepID=UPI0040355D4B